MPKIFVGESSIVALISGTDNVWIGGGYQDFLSKFFCLTLSKTSVGDSSIVALIPGTGKVWRRGGGRSIKILRGKILSHSAENFCRGSFSVSLFSGIEKVWIRGGGKSRFSVEFFFLTLPKISVGEFSIVALISSTGKICKRRGQISRLSVEKFLSHTAENFRSEILYFCIIFGYRKSLEKRGRGGVSRFSVEIFLSNSAEKFRRGTF